MSRMKKEAEQSTELTTLTTTTRNVVESYIFATGHQDLSIYSERLMMLLVKAAQCQVAGLNFKDGSSIAQVSIGPLGDAMVEIEARELLNGPNNTNYTQAKAAVMELMRKPISHERPAIKNGKPLLNDKGEPVYEFEAHNLVNDVYINKKPGVIVVNVNRTTWEAILDFSKGFRRYDLQVAMRFSRTCSLRMFKLISNQKNPLQFTIQELREQWGLTNKYTKTKDFIRNTIVSAKEELDRMSPWTFEFEPVYSASSEQNKGRVGRKSITSIIFFPKHQIKYESTTSTINRVNNPSDLLGRHVIDRLVTQLGFSMAEIKANLVLLDTARKRFDLEKFLIDIGSKANRANNPQGYVVNAIKSHLKEAYGIIVRKDGIVEPKEPVAEPEDVAKAKQAFDQETLSSILSSQTRPQFKPTPLKKDGDDRKLSDILGGLFAEPDEQ